MGIGSVSGSFLLFNNKSLNVKNKNIRCYNFINDNNNNNDDDDDFFSVLNSVDNIERY